MRVALLYVALVGLPVVGLLAVLHAGQRLEAPPDVGGVWRVARGGACGLQEGDTFEIAQSGQYLSVELPRRPAMGGRLTGGVLRARGGARASSAPGCASGPLAFEALTAEPVPRQLRGRVGVPGCAGCPFQSVVAVREAPRRVGEAPRPALH